MTAQLHDSVRFKGAEYSLVGVNGTGLFDPGEHGVKPGRGMCSACWRGFHCVYAVRAQRLYLDTLSVTSEARDRTLFGTQPKPPRRFKSYGFTQAYSGLAHPVAFSGGLLLGRNLVKQLYVHMGFHPAWKFLHVHEILFEVGALKASRDRSEQMRLLRLRMEEVPLTPGLDLGEDELKRWIAKTFSLDYRRED